MSHLCWACAEASTEANERCPECGAPPWKEGRSDGPGVYVIQAECGLIKIGVSIRVRTRFAELVRTSEDPLDLIAVLWGAGRDVESWLHEVFADFRDVHGARDHGLPAPTEWFWPTPALERLIDGTEHMRDGLPWELGGPE